MSKILVIRFSPLAEILMATPLLRCLHQQVPNPEVHVLTDVSYGSVFEASPYVAKTHVLAHSRELMLHELEEEEYDCIIDLQDDRLAHAAEKAGKQVLRFRQGPRRSWWQSLLPGKNRSLPHIAERMVAAAAPLGVQADGQGLDYFIPKYGHTREEDVPAAHHAGYICVAIGADYNTRKFPTEKFASFCAALQHPIILVGDAGDRETADQIAAVDPVKVYNACGKFSLHETADLVRKSKLLVTNDNGYMQLAAALGKRVVSLWGNTTPDQGRWPYYGPGSYQSGNPEQFAVIANNKLRCRPCSTAGYPSCPRKHFRCMEQLAVDDLVARVKTWL